MAAEPPAHSRPDQTQATQRRGTSIMEPTNALDCPNKLNLHTPKPIIPGEPEPPLTPNSWWVERYPQAYHSHGSPFLELTEQADKFSTQILPVTINVDFMACT